MAYTLSDLTAPFKKGVANSRGSNWRASMVINSLESSYDFDSNSYELPFHLVLPYHEYRGELSDGRTAKVKVELSSITVDLRRASQDKWSETIMPKVKEASKESQESYPRIGDILGIYWFSRDGRIPMHKGEPSYCLSLLQEIIRGKTLPCSLLFTSQREGFNGLSFEDFNKQLRDCSS